MVFLPEKADSQAVSGKAIVYVKSNYPDKPEAMTHFDAVTRQYHIQFGDTINGIAEALNVNANTIVSDNQVSDANLIYTGNQLYITQQQNGYVPANKGYQVAQEVPTASLVSEFDGIELQQVVAK